jgi:hypothetical protein
MSDEKNDELHDEMSWENMPPSAKRVVYEHLRAMVAQHRRDSAMATLLRDVSMKDSAPLPPNPIEVMHEVAATAFGLALETLEDMDPDLCPDCGGYHDEGYVHVPSTNPKDLS